MIEKVATLLLGRIPFTRLRYHSDYSGLYPKITKRYSREIDFREVSFLYLKLRSSDASLFPVPSLCVWFESD